MTEVLILGFHHLGIHSRGDKTRCDAGAGAVLGKHQRLQLGESLVRSRRAIHCPYTHNFNYRPNKTCRNKKAKIISLIKWHKLWSKADSQYFCPCQGKGAYLAWGKRIWGELVGGVDGAVPWQQRKELAAQPPKNITLPMEINLALKSV